MYGQASGYLATQLLIQARADVVPELLKAKVKGCICSFLACSSKKLFAASAKALSEVAEYSDTSVCCSVGAAFC